MLWANSADHKFMIFFLFFPKISLNITCKLSPKELSKPIFRKKKNDMNISVCHFLNGKYRVQPNYRTYTYKRTVKQFCSLQVTASVLFVYFIKAHVVGTHLNCTDLSMQFKYVPTTCAFIKKIRKKSHKHHQVSPLLMFFMPRRISGEVLCYTVRNFECPSVCQSALHNFVSTP